MAHFSSELHCLQSNEGLKHVMLYIFHSACNFVIGCANIIFEQLDDSWFVPSRQFLLTYCRNIYIWFMSNPKKQFATNDLKKILQTRISSNFPRILDLVKSSKLIYVYWNKENSILSFWLRNEWLVSPPNNPWYTSHKMYMLITLK